MFLGFPGDSAGKETTCNVGDVGDLGSIPGLGRSPGEGKGYPLQYSGLENSMDSPWGRRESDITERLSLSLTHQDRQKGEKETEGEEISTHFGNWEVNATCSLIRSEVK